MVNETNDAKNEGVMRQINCLALEVVLRLQRDNPELLQRLFYAFESGETSTSKNSENKTPNKRHGK
ncbi:MAG: hypothetical protein COS15_03505 [Caldiserica bacterium CG02_land_8_20_14_3_00_36_38]|nr:hypothetical protein [Caldisericota bacterium]OIP12451.1 MAG: hypothetical protein AUJ99_04670 [Caldisericum sp. CG2_30_36_11]PIV55479.1 MAG: hypothetical protein COS15_03505 [Caldiserica bacterium CG02_land_8_20_14_3_00_36_38]PIW10459.1 MAG: hypothetical protein COW37_03225 [Caldiserica bacterium CG17_big_fil_post_rev_8_21_14_2_50_35_7]